MDAVTAAPRDTQGVTALLASTARPNRKIGVELETCVLRVDDLQPALYEGPSGIRALLERMAAANPGTQLHHEGEFPVGLELPSGQLITLEPGGQVEISTTPHTGLGHMASRLYDTARGLATCAEDVGLMVVAASLVPVAAGVPPWMPKQRYRVMREHFAALGEPGRLAHTMMQRTTSTQVSLDFRDPAEAARMLRLGFLAAPVATALFANSPFDGLVDRGFQSFRAEAWRYTDPARCGIVAPCLAPDADLSAWVDYALDVPMMFRVRGKEHLAMHGASFRAVLEAGRWDDGVAVSEADVWTHMSGIFTDARLKKGLLELRSTDAQLPGELGAVWAFWTGLFYDDDAFRRAEQILDVPAEAVERAAAEAPKLGLEAKLDGRPLLEVARELQAAARGGLERRVAAGVDEPCTLGLIEPAERRLAEGRSPADDLRARWEGEWARDPRRMIEALRYAPDAS
jgi:glutamate--cysteine ligase